MQIMVITPEPPSSAQINGGSTRQYHLYKRLLELGHHVTIVAPFVSEREGEIAGLEADGFEVRPYRRPSSRLLEVFSAIVRRPKVLLSAWRLSYNDLIGAIYWSRMHGLVRELLHEVTFDVIAVEHELGAQWIDSLPSDVPSILTIHQVESAYYSERAVQHTGLSRFVSRRNARRAARSERRWAPRFDAVVCMSRSEIELLTRASGPLQSSFAIGNGADHDWLATIGEDPGENRVLFTGTMQFEPNILAAEFLAREVMPLVHARVPAARVQIVGRDPGPRVRELDLLDGVSVHASVPDMRPYFEGASVCTLPMLEGGGTRLKLAEAFAAGRAVVSTSNGATGVEVEDGRELLIADGAVDFASAICELLEDGELRAQIADAGRKFGRDHLSWPELGNEWAEVLKQLVSFEE